MHSEDASFFRFYEWDVSSDAGTPTPRAVRVLFWRKLYSALARQITTKSYIHCQSCSRWQQRPMDSVRTAAGLLAMTQDQRGHPIVLPLL